jgi:hypothetical protein
MFLGKRNEKLCGNLALAHLITGLLGPNLLILLLNEDIALGFGGLAIALTFLFGILGWKEKTAKVAVIVACCVCLFVAVNGAICKSKSKNSQNLFLSQRITNADSNPKRCFAACLPSGKTSSLFTSCRTTLD